MVMATAAWRKARAVELALQGHSYDAIAAEVGYANRGTAWRTVSKALAERADIAVEDLRTMEMARLDYLQSRLGPQVEVGDVKAITAATRIVQARSRLMGLDKIEPPAEDGHTVVLDVAELARRGEAWMKRGQANAAAWMDEQYGPEQ